MNIIEKYNIPVPRYTSYPPANYFREMTSGEYLQSVSDSNTRGSRTLSFYLHLPFCKRLCHYCGCNSYILPKDQSVVDSYISALHKEIDIICSGLDNTRPISQIHYGGGSPTAMPVNVLRELNEHLLSKFPTIDKPEIAIECHPGYLSENDWKALTESHFNRFSLGIQDLDERVLKTVGRQPSALPLDRIMEILKSANATVNMDFLYGLPYQTVESFEKNILKAISLRPDRLVTFGYGHVPWVFKRQLILEKHVLPESQLRQAIYDRAAGLLQEAGYKSIGMDHFVLPDDELFVALQNGNLYRNFQGYCTRRTTGQVYAFGATGISQLEYTYAQNTKDIDEYIRTIQSGNLTIKKGYQLTNEQRICKEVIEYLMCNYRVDFQQIADNFGIGVDTVRDSLNYNEAHLQEMISDGIISMIGNELRVTDLGRPYVRYVAAAIDPLMINKTNHFSKPI